MVLTYLKIQNSKPVSRAYKLADSKALYLFVRPNGSKLWRMNYRHLDRQRTLHLGQCEPIAAHVPGTRVGSNVHAGPRPLIGRLPSIGSSPERGSRAVRRGGRWCPDITELVA
jgi:hypothetical protein